jgi:putative thiamine transport system permease protein
MASASKEATAGRAPISEVQGPPPPRGPLLRHVPAVTLVLMLGPAAAGVIGTLLPAFGFLPALGGETLSLAPWRALASTPGLGRSVWLSVTAGIVCTAVSLAFVVAMVAAFQGTRPFTWMQRALSPLLSVPHAAAAFGLAFLIAPSGWIVRALSPWLTGWDRPPDVVVIGDAAGLAMMAGLIVKEVPFLLLMTLAALGQTQAREARAVALSLGYRPVTGWLKTVLPRLYPQIRLPVYAVLAYSMSVVDVAMILGPTTPPTLAVRLVQWMNDPDLSLRFQAAAGATLQMLLVAGVIGVWRLAEIISGRIGRRWISAGGRGSLLDAATRPLAVMAAVATAGAAGLGLIGLATWSLAGFWGFPDALPDALSLRTWGRLADDLIAPLWITISIGAAATAAAITLTLGCLENEARWGARPTTSSLYLLYIPLIVPQVGFLFGLQVFMSTLSLDRAWISVVGAHLVFVLPYVFLALADPWRAWDKRYAVAGRALGAGPDRVFWRIRLPMLLAPALTAAAVGFAVSVGQYLPTLLVGGGRWPTITTEAVALASGGDRRVIGVYALVQMLLPLLAFLIATIGPALAFRRRKGLTP